MNEYDKEKGNFSINVEKLSHEKKIIVNIKYTSRQIDLKKHNIKDLPYEINVLISEFLPSTMSLKMLISYGDNYPFSGGPSWRLLECNDKLTGLHNIHLYYEYIVDCHNKSNISNNWSPAITFDKDILSFIVKINNFEDIKMLKC